MKNVDVLIKFVEALIPVKTKAILINENKCIHSDRDVFIHVTVFYVLSLNSISGLIDL